MLLQEKLERLYELDRIIQDQSFKVTSLEKDRVRSSQGHLFR